MVPFSWESINVAECPALKVRAWAILHMPEIRGHGCQTTMNLWIFTSHNYSDVYLRLQAVRGGGLTGQLQLRLSPFKNLPKVELVVIFFWTFMFKFIIDFWFSSLLSTSPRLQDLLCLSDRAVQGRMACRMWVQCHACLLLTQAPSQPCRLFCLAIDTPNTCFCVLGWVSRTCVALYLLASFLHIWLKLIDSLVA